MQERAAEILKGLKQLRRLDGPYKPRKLLEVPRLIELIAYGDVHRAADRIQEVIWTYSPNDKRVKAACAMLAFEPYHIGAMEARLDVLAKEEFADPATIRRWGDIGLNKLAHRLAVRDDEIFRPPLVVLTAWLKESALDVTIRYYYPAGLTFPRRPTVIIDDRYCLLKVPWSPGEDEQTVIATPHGDLNFKSALAGFEFPFGELPKDLQFIFPSKTDLRFAGAVLSEVANVRIHTDHVLESVGLKIVPLGGPVISQEIGGP